MTTNFDRSRIIPSDDPDIVRWFERARLFFPIQDDGTLDPEQLRIGEPDVHPYQGGEGQAACSTRGMISLTAVNIRFVVVKHENAAGKLTEPARVYVETGSDGIIDLSVSPTVMRRNGLSAEQARFASESRAAILNHVASHCNAFSNVGVAHL